MSPEQSGIYDLNLLDLPHDILLAIVHFLPPKSLFTFLSTCQLLQSDRTLHTSARYWRTSTISKFRLPNYPIIAEDGKHWKDLYRRMHTDTRLYNWGSNKNGLLGDRNQVGYKIAWPLEVTARPSPHAIADIVCGGYFTAILTTSGEVWVRASLPQPGWSLASRRDLLVRVLEWRLCRFPPDDEHLSEDRHARTVEQISATREGVVGLTESGAMWYWYWEDPGGQLVHSNVRMVRGGWNTCSAMRPHPDCEVLVWRVTRLVIEQIPRAILMTSARLSDYIGEVVNWVMMRDYILLVTQPGRVWAWHIDQSITETTPIELPIELKRQDCTVHEEVADVCGWLERFALLMRNGEVLIGTLQALEQHVELGIPLEFQKIPALQKTGVIKIAFGDWHYHALHKDGTISSYGHEPEGCGALGIGGPGPSLARRGFSSDHILKSECLTTGRRVHFEPQKEAWVRHLAKAYTVGRGTEDWPGDDTWYELSEWVEERLRAWATPENEDMILPEWKGCITREGDIEEDSETPAYFATSVAACGWHSAALVLVDAAKAESIKRKYKLVNYAAVSEALPRLQLLDGSIMAGEGPVFTWSRASGCPRPKAVEIVRW